MACIRVKRLNPCSVKLEQWSFSQSIKFNQLFLFKVFWFEMKSLLKSHKIKIFSIDFFALENFRNRFGQLSFFEIFYNKLYLIELNCCMDFLRDSFNLAFPAFLKIFGFFMFLRNRLLNVLLLLEIDAWLSLNTRLNFV